MFPNGIAGEEERRFGVVYDMMDIIGVEVLQNRHKAYGGNRLTDGLETNYGSIYHGVYHRNGGTSHTNGC